MPEQKNHLKKSIPAVFLYQTSGGETVCRTIGHDLVRLPFWLYQREALYHPKTPSATRAMLFNMVVAVQYKAGHKTYAYRIDYHYDKKIGAFLAVYMTPAGMTMLGEERKNVVRGRYNPSEPDAEEMWQMFKAPLRRALVRVGMAPNTHNEHLPPH